MSLDGTELKYAGFIGGDGYDDGNDIAVDGLGNAYIVGRTDSGASHFPVKVGPDLTYNGDEDDQRDAFVAKVNPAGHSAALRRLHRRRRLGRRSRHRSGCVGERVRRGVHEI